MKVYLTTLGCRLNESEIEMMGRMFRHLGHEVIEEVDGADICVINTCAVTNEAGRKSRQLIYQANRKAPEAKIVVTGCYSEIEKDKVSEIPGVVEVVSNMKKDVLVPRILGLGEEETYDVEPLAREANPGELGRTRAFLKVQDGCNNRCTFCVTTIARGPGRSRSADEILHEVKSLSAVGYNEMVLSGVHLGSYGRDLDEDVHLGTLLERILAETEVPRIRLSSLEPWDIPEGFFDLWSNPRLCRYLHLPLQAGCDKTLKRMARRTRKALFRSLVLEAREKIPGVAISSDMIVGFPGETDEEFAETRDFIEEMDFCHMHVFRYSPRPGTAAARMPGQIHGSKKAERSQVLQQMAKEGRRRFYENAIGQEADVLWEQRLEQEDGSVTWQGLTDHYIRVRTSAPRNLHNHLLPVRLLGVDEDGVVKARLL